MQMAQPRSWVQTPALGSIATAPGPGNRVVYVRTPVQHMTVPVAPVVRPPVIRPLVMPMKPIHPPAPRWIYAAPLKQQRPAAQSIPGANAAPKVVAVKIGTPHAKKDNPLIEGRVPTQEGVETIKPSDFKSMWEQNLFELFENQEGIVVVDLRGEDRAAGTIAGALPIPALEFLKDLPKWCANFKGKPIVGFFCQYSAHRAPTVANLYRKDSHPTQRVVVMEGGFRGWEAQKLPVEKQSPQLSQAGYDNIALELGSEMLSLSQV
eukprot:s1294_g7.t1